MEAVAAGSSCANVRVESVVVGVSPCRCISSVLVIPRRYPPVIFNRPLARAVKSKLSFSTGELSFSIGFLNRPDSNSTGYHVPASLTYKLSSFTPVTFPRTLNSPPMGTLFGNSVSVILAGSIWSSALSVSTALLSRASIVPSVVGRNNCTSIVWSGSKYSVLIPIRSRPSDPGMTGI